MNIVHGNIFRPPFRRIVFFLHWITYHEVFFLENSERVLSVRVRVGWRVGRGWRGDGGGVGRGWRRIMEWDNYIARSRRLLYAHMHTYGTYPGGYI